jgi:hypothetical protein
MLSGRKVRYPPRARTAVIPDNTTIEVPVLSPNLDFSNNKTANSMYLGLI